MKTPIQELMDELENMKGMKGLTEEYIQGISYAWKLAAQKEEKENQAIMDAYREGYCLGTYGEELDNPEVLYFVETFGKNI